MSARPGDRVDVGLRPWRRDDLELMRRLLGDPAMTTYLGGPESPEQLQSRLDRYLAMTPEDGRVFVITAGPDGEPAGSVVFWAHSIRDEPALEIGWGVLPAFQGRGIATRATARCLEIAAAETGYRTIHAFPSVDNAASNAVCRKLGLRAHRDGGRRVSGGALDDAATTGPSSWTAFGCRAVRAEGEDDPTKSQLEGLPRWGFASPGPLRDDLTRRALAGIEDRHHRPAGRVRDRRGSAAGARRPPGAGRLDRPADRDRGDDRAPA